MTLTKVDIIDSIHHRLGLPKSKSIQVTETLLEIIKRTIASGEDVLITGFGKFCVKDKKKRRGRNPQTGEDMALRGTSGQVSLILFFSLCDSSLERNPSMIPTAKSVLR